MDDDSLFCILSYLDLLDILNCELVNKQFNLVSRNELIWKSLSHIVFKDLIHNQYRLSFESYYKLDKYLRAHNEDLDDIKISKSLTMTYRNIHKLPNEIGLLTNLRTLILYRNFMSSLPVEFSSLTNLEHLSLGYNNFEIIPQEILSLTKLQYLSLERNNLEIIPEELCELTNLESLFLHENKLTKLPNEISRLTKLTRFDMEGNMFDTLPNLGELTNLRHLCVSEYQHKFISKDLKSMIHIVSDAD
jgi:Leucine-rich repeat (LRR) protein